MIPRRYLLATLFIAALLVLLAVVQGPRTRSAGGIAEEPPPVMFSLETFRTLAELPLRDGWAPRFQGTLDPDQPHPWPFGGGFETPWEPASPYLADQGVETRIMYRYPCICSRPTGSWTMAPGTSL